ncbi:MAG: acyl-CoA dehydrogenase family protein [Marmoricola sp.]
MDFSPTSEMTEAAALAAQIFGDYGTPDNLRLIDAQNDRFDAALWSALGDAGLLGLAIPEEHGGAGLGILEIGAVLTEQGRTLGAVPLATHVAASLAIAEFGDDAAKALLADAASGASILTVASTVDRVDNSWVAVPAATRASAFVVVDENVRLVSASEVSVEPQHVSTGEILGLVRISPEVLAAAPVLGDAAAAGWVRQRLTVLQCAVQLGVTEGGLLLTAEYARTREQFGRPIGTFQAVSQRLADGYIDNLGLRMALQQALWRLSAGLPSAKEVAGAAIWAADAGHRIAHTTVHVHGGVGIDLDGEAHRFFASAKVNEFIIGGATEHALSIGRAFADA